MSTAISLRKQGIEVDLIDLDPQWRVYGAGITITGATLRAFQALGILDAVMERAYTGDGIQVCEAQGAPSHVDTFDHKPLLTRDNGKPSSRGNATLLGSPFEFAPLNLRSGAA